MTRNQAKDMLPIIQAYADGKTIQVNDDGDTNYMDVKNPTFTARPERYRIKPEPREVKMWVHDDRPLSICLNYAVGYVSPNEQGTVKLFREVL